MLAFLVSLLLFLAPQMAYAQVDPNADTLYADSWCAQGHDFCATGLYSPAQKSINYTVIIKGSPPGWRSIAVGDDMEKSNMGIFWIADNQVVFSHRSVNDHTEPKTALAIASYNLHANVTRAGSDMTVVSWTFPQTTPPGSSLAHIWGVNSKTGPKSTDPGATITIHDAKGSFELDFTKAYSGQAPATPSGVTALAAWGDTNSSAANGSASATSTDTATSSDSTSSTETSGASSSFMAANRLWWSHMFLMIGAWLVFAPAGMLVGRFGRVSTAFKWFPAHRILQSLAFLLTFIGFWVAVGGVQRDSGSHFSSLHEKLGLAIFLLLLAQVGLGIFSHWVRARNGFRLTGLAHWGLGVALFVLSVYNLCEGFKVWSWQNVPSYASIIVGVYASLLGVAYLGGMLLVPKQQAIERARGRECVEEKE